MASWTLVPCLVTLRAEVNALAPGRDKRSDGSIGDQAHADSPSDHNPDETGETPYEDADSTNEVHAIDLDHTGPWPAGWSMERVVQVVVARHRAGLDNRLQNVIYKRRIWSRSWAWGQRTYTGSNAHTEHAHFSARYTTAQEADTRPWGLIEEDDVTPEDRTKIAQEAAELISPGVTKVLEATRQVAIGALQGREAEAARDATISASIAQLTELVRALAASSGAVTPEELAELKQAMRAAAATAGAEAAARVEAKVDALREHLGDDDDTKS